MTMTLRILAIFMLVLAVNRLTLAQDSAKPAEPSTTAAPAANNPQARVGAAEVEPTAPASSVLSIETTADIEQSEVLSKVVEALEKEGIAKRTNEDRVAKPVDFHAEIRVRRDVPFDQVRQMIETMKSLSINSVMFASEERDASNAIIVICPADVTWRKVREVQKALENHKEFKLDVRVAADNGPVTPTTSRPVKLQEDVQYFPPSPLQLSKPGDIFDGAGASFRIVLNSDGTNRGSVAELRQRYEALEQQCRALAGNLKEPLRDPAEGQNLKASLRKSVKQAFLARQELQRAELTEFAKRLKRLQQTIELRERSAEKIVDRRVDELLDPNLTWEASNVGENSASDLNKRPVATFTAPPSVPTPGILGKSPAELHELLTERARSVEQIQESIRRWEQKRTDGHDVKETESAMASLRKQLEEYNRKFALAQRELIEQIQLLKAERQRDQDRLHSIEEALLKAEISDQFLLTAENAIQDLKLSVQRTESLLKLYQQAGEGLVSQDPPAAALRTSPTNPKEIGDSAWGEPVQGLKMAIVANSENAPRDQPLEVHCVVENISPEPITIRTWGESLVAAKSEVRRTSGAQVQTIPNGKSGMTGGKVIELVPGQRAVLTTMTIRVTEDVDVKSVPDNADLLIVDNRAFEFRNAIYVLKCTLQLNLGNGEFSISSGPVAIAFHRPAESHPKPTKPTGTNNH
jgi:hypothetical protein